MGPAPRLLSVILLLLCVISPSLSLSSEPREVAPRQADCSASNCTTCLSSNVQCAWCNSGSQSQCYNTVVGTCDGLTLHYSCVQEDACYQQSSCGACTNVAGCGWCDSACVLGSSTGPDASNLQCTEWIPAGKPCDTNCSLYLSSCAECFSQPLCDWCLDENSCKEISDHGACFDWAPSCPDLCSSVSDCLTCTSNDACTWCYNDDAPSSCVPTASNPGLNCDAIYTKFCDDTCVGITSCDGCTQNPSCGWCADPSERCIQGDANGPFFGVSCDNWMSESCMVPFSCQSTLGCEACNEDSHCCFDLNSGQCTFRSATGGNCEDSCPSKNRISGVMIFFLVLLSIVSTAAIVAGAIMWYKFYWQRRHYFERLA